MFGKLNCSLSSSWQKPWSAKREPPLCKGRWPKSLILAGGVVKVRQSPSQKSEIFDSPLYTRGPFGAVQDRTPNYNLYTITDHPKLQQKIPIDKKGLNFPWPFGIIPTQMQDSYIGNTTASQAVKAGSTPVSCSKRKDTPPGCLFFLVKAAGVEPIQCGAGERRRRGLDRAALKNNRLPYPAPKRSLSGCHIILITVLFCLAHQQKSTQKGDLP